MMKVKPKRERREAGRELCEAGRERKVAAAAAAARVVKAEPKREQKVAGQKRKLATRGKGKASAKGKGKQGSGRKKVRRIDFSKIKWGAFTKMLEEYRKRHPRTRIKTLEQFAHLILREAGRGKPNPKFDLTARRRALFYLNVILKRKKQ
jgi:hypothetical protein